MRIKMIMKEIVGYSGTAYLVLIFSCHLLPFHSVQQLVNIVSRCREVCIVIIVGPTKNAILNITG